MEIPEQYAALLQSNALANIASLGPDGAPQNNPVWFEWDGEYLKFSNTKGRQKYKNLLRDPRVAVSIVDPTNPGLYIELRGKVEKFEDDPNLAFINKLAKKYLNQEAYPYHQPGDERVTLYVRPEHIPSRG